MVFKIRGLSKQLRQHSNLYRTQNLGPARFIHWICHILIKLPTFTALASTFLVVNKLNFLFGHTNQCIFPSQDGQNTKKSQQPPTRFSIIFQSSRNRKLFSKTHFAGLLGEVTSCYSSLYGHQSFPFSSFTLEPYESTPAPHPWWGTSQAGRGSVALGCWTES